MRGDVQFPTPTRHQVDPCEGWVTALAWQATAAEDGNLEEVFETYGSYVTRLIEKQWHLSLLEKVVGDLRIRVSRLEEHQSIIVHIETFEPEPFDLLRPVAVVVEPTDGEFTATLFDANLSASGETQEEAVSNLKDVLLSSFELLNSEQKLGAAMVRQKAVLNSFIRQR